MTRRVNQVRETIYQDAEGNVTHTTTSREMTVPKEPDFIKLYIKDVLYLKELPAGHNSILMALLKLSNYGNIIILTRPIKKIISESTGLAETTINKAITELVRGDILIRKDRALYVLNPFLFGRGHWKDIEKLRTEMNYSLEGRTWKVQVDEGPNMEAIEGEVDQGMLEFKD